MSDRKQKKKNNRDAVLSLEVLARMPGPPTGYSPTFGVLVRHILDRFFNNDLMSADGDGKTRLVQLAFVVGLPGFVNAIYLYAVYQPLFGGTRPYWGRVGDHYFFVLYSLVATGVLTIFAWDFFFPDMLDVLVLATLPLKRGVMFRARVTTIAILLAAFLIDSNFLAPLVLPAATNPPHLFRFLAAYVVAVSMSGAFAAMSLLALQGVLLAVLGEHGFRRISLWLQGVAIAVLLTILFLYPIMFGSLRALLTSGRGITYDLPPLWFLGIYQRILAGHKTLPVFIRLANTAWTGTIVVTLLAILVYPLAYVRKVSGLVEGVPAQSAFRSKSAASRLLGIVLRKPESRAIWQFAMQTLVGVPRYRIYLALCGGAGFAILISALLRLHWTSGHLRAAISPYGVHAMIPIVAFWTVSGLHTAFLSPADQDGRWIFRVVQGKPALDHLNAAKGFVCSWSLVLSLAAVAAGDLLAPPPSLGWRAIASQLLLALGLSVILSDAFFLNVKTIPFTFKPPSIKKNLAFLVVPYLGFFPAVVTATIALTMWIEKSAIHFALTGLVVLAAHLLMRSANREAVADYLARIDLDEDESEFPMKLGLHG